MASHSPVEDDPKQLVDAQNFWGAFMQGSKWSILAVIVVLIALLVFFVPTGA